MLVCLMRFMSNLVLSTVAFGFAKALRRLYRSAFISQRLELLCGIKKIMAKKNRQKWLTSHIKGDWKDKDYIIETVLVQCLFHYVEKE